MRSESRVVVVLTDRLGAPRLRAVEPVRAHEQSAVPARPIHPRRTEGRQARPSGLPLTHHRNSIERFQRIYSDKYCAIISSDLATRGRLQFLTQMAATHRGHRDQSETGSRAAVGASPLGGTPATGRWDSERVRRARAAHAQEPRRTPTGRWPPRLGSGGGGGSNASASCDRPRAMVRSAAPTEGKSACGLAP